MVYQVIALRSQFVNQLPELIKAELINRVKNMVAISQNHPEHEQHVIYLTLVNLILLQAKNLLSNLSFIEIVESASKLIKENTLYGKPLTHLIAILQSNSDDEEHRKLLMQTFGDQTVDILDVNVKGIQEATWRGIRSNPLENFNFIEYWLESLINEPNIVVDLLM